jgi:rfaE bifunctional protein nucleotidyltransferase chain/domain
MIPWHEAYLKKIVKPEVIEEKVKEWKAEGKKIVTLNGSFDLLHAGHLYIIHQAKLQGDLLFVALNSDASIRAYKSPDRPIIKLNHRLEMMAALEFVDFLTWFDETDPRKILERIAPDVHVNGAEYGDNCIEAEVVRRHGGRLHLVERIPLLSSSEVITKIKSLP